MKNHFTVVALLFLAINLSAQSLYYPPKFGNFWAKTNPSSLNWCQSEIQDLYQFLDQENTKSFIVLKNGRIVLEAYFNGHSKTTTYPWNSAGKSLRAFLMGIAQEDGLLDIEDRSSAYLGIGWTNLNFFKERLIKVHNQLSMTTGLNENWFNCVNPICLNYVADAGDRWAYHNGPYNLLKNIIESTSGMSLNQYTYEEVEKKIGMSGDWQSTLNFTIYNSTARDMALFALLMLGKGKWKNNQILQDMSYYNQMITSSQSINPSYGFLWWLNGKNTHMLPGSQQVFQGPIAPDAPSDVFAAVGKNGQYISVSPSTGLVMIRQGDSNSTSNAPIDLHNEIWQRIMNLDCQSQSKLLSSSQNQELSVWPNPASNFVQVRLGEDDQVATARLIDPTGKLIKTYNAQNELAVQGIASGLYFLEIEGISGQRYTQKLWIK